MVMNLNGKYKLRIELVDKNGMVAVVEYRMFIIGDEKSHYILTVNSYVGNNDIPGKVLL